MLDGILDDRLEDERGDAHLGQFVGHVDLDLEALGEAALLDFEIERLQFDFLGQRDALRRVERQRGAEEGREGEQHLLGPAIEAHGSDTVRRIFASYHREFPLLDEAEFLRALAKRTYYARIWSEFLDAHPLFLCPFLPGPFFAANRDAEGVEGVRDVLGVALYSYIVNFIGLPSGVVSAGWAEGRPAAVQIVGRRWREDAIIDALEVVERAAGAPDVELRRRMAAG